MGHELEDYWKKKIKDNRKENAEDENLKSDPVIDSRPPHQAFAHPHGDRPFHVPVESVAKGRRGEVRHLLNFDESNDKVEVAGIVDESLAGEKNRRLSAFLSTCSHTLKPGDIIEAVNLQTDIEEIQRELRTALSVELRVARTKDLNVYDRSAVNCPGDPRVSLERVPALEMMED